MDSRRHPGLLVLLVALAALLGGCGLNDDSGPDQSNEKTDAPSEPAATVEESDLEAGDVDESSLELEEVGGSGISGTARIEPAEGDRISISIELDGEDTGTHGVEAHLGRCADALDPGAAQEFLDEAASYTLADVEDGEMHDDAKLPDDIVSEGTYSVLVHEGADLDSDIAACVDVEVE
jgi:hypothetical protein